VHDRLAGGLARGRTGGRHCTAGQYGYVPLGRHLVSTTVYRLVDKLRLSMRPYPVTSLKYLSLSTRPLFFYY